MNTIQNKAKQSKTPICWCQTLLWEQIVQVKSLWNQFPRGRNGILISLAWIRLWEKIACIRLICHPQRPCQNLYLDLKISVLPRWGQLQFCHWLQWDQEFNQTFESNACFILQLRSSEFSVFTVLEGMFTNWLMLRILHFRWRFRPKKVSDKTPKDFCEATPSPQAL